MISAPSGPAGGGCLYLTVILGRQSRRFVTLLDLLANPFRVTAWAGSNAMKRNSLPGRRFGKTKSAERGGDPGAADEHCLAIAIQGLHLPQQHGQSILFA